MSFSTGTTYSLAGLKETLQPLNRLKQEPGLDQGYFREKGQPYVWKPSHSRC